MLLQKIVDQKVKIFKEKDYFISHPELRNLIKKLNKQGGYLFKEDLIEYFKKSIMYSINYLENNSSRIEKSNKMLSNMKNLLKSGKIEELSDISIAYNEFKGFEVKSFDGNTNLEFYKSLELLFNTEIEIEERTVIVKFFKRNKLRERFRNGRELKNYLQRFKKFDDMSLISINKFSYIEDIKTPIWIEYRPESNSIEAHYEKYYEFRNGRFVDDMYPEIKSIVSVDTYYEYNQIPDLFISEGSKYDLEAIRNFYEFEIL